MNVRPTASFNQVKLQLESIPAGRKFYRLYPARYPDPLGFGTTPSRFSDPRRSRRKFGVLYLGTSVEVCFIEAILRDNRNGVVGDYPIDTSELDAMRLAEIAVRQGMSVVDLTENGSLIMGVPSDVTGATRQTLARQWSVAFHEHGQQPDGIFYTSRLNKSLTCLAVYDRAIGKLHCMAERKLTAAREFPGLLDTFQVALI